MKKGLAARTAGRRLQGGAAAVEFALISALFLMALLVGIIEIGRVFYYLNATAEATRLGARIAVVCEKSTTDAFIRARMVDYVNVLPASSIAIQWEPQNCQAESTPVCQRVTVSVLPGTTFDTFIPFVPITWTLPPFSTTLPRESMKGDIEGSSNPVCR